MSKRNLLLCFDAFGTLFRPKEPIEQQYGEIARQVLSASFSNDQVRSSFRAAFRAQAKANPNYGKTTNLGATQWWTNVIHATFTPLLATARNEVQLPDTLAPRLLQRFASSEGYTMFPRLPGLLRRLRDQRLDQRLYEEIVVGIITNSDDRVPGIFSSFGLRVSPLRYSAETQKAAKPPPNSAYDIDFHCMSYDVGVEKPDARIFRAAEELLAQVLAQSGSDPGSTDLSTWDKMYVGDDYDKDVVGAQNAGWYPVFLMDETRQQEQHAATRGDNIHNSGTSSNNKMQLLDDCPAQSLASLYKCSKILAVYSPETVVNWLTGHQRAPSGIAKDEASGTEKQNDDVSKE